MKAQRSFPAALLFAMLLSAPTATLFAAEKTASRAPAPPGGSWSDYNVIMWQPQNLEQCKRLKELGITAGALMPRDRDDPGASIEEQASPFLACGERWYVENIATDFYAPYHRWWPDRPVNWRFIEVKKNYQRDPQDRAAFIRDPSLSDPHWLDIIRARLAKTVKAHRAYQPLFYNLADESGIADLSAFWDFDFSSASLKGMRRWLKQQYGGLAQLNREWGSQFRAWDEVMPMTTAAAMQRHDENYAAWGDFKAWMDVAFARAIAIGRAAIHAADPRARAAIEGGQVPGWGGYDYARLATAVDVMELYDGGGNLEIVRSLNPKAILLTTSFAKGPHEVHDIWRELLRGSRGLILWDPAHQVVTPDGLVGERGRDLAPVLREIHSGLGALLIQSRRVTAPVAVLYSPASIRTQWMLDWQPRGDAWSARDPGSVYEDRSAVRDSMTGFLSLLQRLGLEPRILVPELIEKGELRRGGFRALILPRAVSLSSAEADQIRRFARDGGLVIADGEPGRFDQHSRRRGTLPLAPLFRSAAESAGAGVAPATGRAIYFPLEQDSGSGDVLQSFRRLLGSAGITPQVKLGDDEDGGIRGDIDINQWRNGRVTIIALQRERPESAEGEASNQATDPRGNIAIRLSHPAYLYDLRQARFLAYGDHVVVPLDPIRPAILAASPERRPLPRISGTQHVRRGGTIRLRVATAPNELASRPLFHIEVTDPSGRALSAVGENLAMSRGKCVWVHPVASDAQAGTWQIRITDTLGGGTTTWPVEVR